MALNEYLVRARKFSMKACCRNSVGSGSMFWFFEDTKIDPNTTNGYLGHVAVSAAMPMNTLVASLVVSVFSCILLVLAMGGFAQVLPPIIGRIRGFVVYLIGWPSSHHDDKCQSMGQILFVTNGEGPVFNSSASNAAGQGTSLDSSRSVHFPPHLSGYRIIGQDGSDEFWRQRIFHGVNVCLTPI